MSTKAYYPINEIGAGKVGFSTTRSIIEAAFYGNNVVKVNTLKEAYELAKNSPGTVVTDMPIKDGETLIIGGMLREEEYCKIAPDLSMAVEKSGLETTFEKTDGYKYTKESIKRETDVFDPDVLSHLKKEKKKEEPNDKEVSE